jgi:hypothetical protein
MSDIARVASSLDDLNRWSVLKGVAALALWPANADRMRSLAALSHVLVEGAGSCAADGRPPVTADRWRRLLTSDEGRPLRELFSSDYYKAPPAVDGMLLSVRIMLLSGLLEAPALHLALWSEAIRAALVQHSDMHLEAASRLVLSATCLSDMVLRDGGLEHTRWPSHPLQGEIGVPDDRTYERLLSAVDQPLLDPSESVVCLPALLPLVAGNGRQPAAPWLSPLIVRDGRVLVASPADLLRATLARAAQAVMRSPARGIAVEELRRASARALRTAAADMRWRLEDESDAGGFLFRFDVDKLAAVELMVAPVQSDDREHVDVRPAFDAAARRLEERRRQDPEVDIGVVLFVGDGRPPRTTPAPADQPFGPWLLTLGDFQLLGDALRLDPTALWRLLRAVVLSNGPSRAVTLDALGQLHREEAPIHPEVAPLVSDVGHEYLHQHARLMATRHIAPHPYEPRWVEVTRWPGTPSPKVFAADRAVDAYALLARHGGRFCWVMADEKVEDREDLLAMLVEMTTFWAVRMLDVGWLLLPEGAPAPLDRGELEATVHVVFDDRPGPALIVRETGIRRVEVVFGQAFLGLLARPDNHADRILVGALLQWWFRVDSKRLQPLVDRAAPAGRGTFVVLGDPAARRRPPVAEPPEPLPRSTWREVDLAVAASIVDEGEALAASGGEAKALIDRVVHALVVLFDEALGDCGPDLLPALLGLNERVATFEELRAITVPIRAELPDSDSGGPRPDAGIAVALRGLVERVTARPPTGSGRASLTRLARLRVLAEFVVDWGVASDALMSGTATATVEIDGDGCRLDLEGPLPQARRWVETRRVATEPERMLEAHAERWAPSDVDAPRLDEPLPTDTDPAWQEIDQAMEESWGFRWDELLRTVTALAVRALDQPEAVVFATPEDTIQAAYEATRIPRDRVTAIIAELTLGECPEYHQLRRGHKPWDSNRERSYIRRPLALMADGRLGWTWSHTKRVPHYYATQIVWERLRCTGALSGAISRLARRLDRAFEDDLASACADLEWEVEVRVKRVAGTRLERTRGQDIGDVDVVAFDRRLGELWLLDAKRLAPAFTPNDMARERDALKSSIDRHLERVAWVRERLGLLVDDPRFGSPDHGGDWRVEAALITDHPLVGANMGWQGLAVWSVDELQYRLPRERS